MNDPVTDVERMPLDTVLAEIIGLGAEISCENGRLSLRGPAEALTGALTGRLRQRRDELVELLAGRRALPLSSVQQRLLFLQRLDPSGLGYTFSYVHRLRGVLDPDVLHEAFAMVVAAHPGLRAGFAEIGGRAVQLIDADVEPECRVHIALDCEPEQAHRILRAELIKPFDFTRPPLLRSVLVRTGDDDWLWGISVHHLVADGWTCAQIMREVSRAYTGQPVSRAEADYAEFVAWDRAQGENPRRSAAVEHWVGLLQGVTDGELPLDHPRPPIRTYRGGLARAVLDEPTIRALTDLARAERTTLFAALLAVHATFLIKHTGHDHAVIGTPHANRPSARFHHTAGCFVSTVVLPVDLSGEPTFRTSVAAMGRMSAAGWDHQDFPYEQLVERLAPARDTSRNALFQSFFALQDVPMRLDLAGISTEPLGFADGITQFDLEAHVTPDDSGRAVLEIRFNTDIFDPATGAAFARRWQALAGRLAADPDRSVHAIPMATDVDHAVIAAANDTRRRESASHDVDRIFAAQAARTPDRVALRCSDRTLTYRELDAIVDQMAAAVSASVPIGARVGILLPRSPEMVAAVLATLRAGASFVPLPVDLPAERMPLIAANVRLAAVWTAPETHALVPGDLPRLSPTVPTAGIAARRVRAGDGSQTAYILHTSGSTDLPKGVEIPDRALANLLRSMGEAPGLSSSDVLVAVTALFFDISLLELLLPLSIGATVVVATDEQARDPRLLADLLARSGATVMQATPSTWRMLLDAGWGGQQGLRAWCGGESLSRDLADRLLVACGQVWNLYGPTETTIWSTRWRVDADGPIMIGTPIADTTVHILDSRGRPVPPGVSGELCIGGAGLALGYVGRPELTAERFAPIATESGTVTAYRTGDLARQRPNGELRLLGRIDDQLKVRGHRVEPEEIEYAIRTHPDVLDVVVVLTDSGLLVAHVHTEPDVAVPESELVRFAAGVLRQALVPQRFVTHTELPHTANGKIDRNRLRRTVLPPPARAGTGAPPATPDEMLVASVYQEVLGLGAIARDDDFFLLGGHSLAATRVLHRIEQVCGVGIALYQFMQDATVATVAGLLTGDADQALLEALAVIEAMSDAEADAIGLGATIQPKGEQ